jgi:hypothetical protein
VGKPERDLDVTEGELEASDGLERRRPELLSEIPFHPPDRQIRDRPHAEASQQAAQSNREDGYHEPWRVKEPAEDQEFDENRYEHRGDDPSPEGQAVREIPHDDGVVGEDRPRGAERGLREVDHPARAVDEDDADGGEGVQCTVYKTVEQQGHRGPPVPALAPRQHELRDDEQYASRAYRVEQGPKR